MIKRKILMFCVDCCWEWYGQFGDRCPQCESSDTEPISAEELKLEEIKNEK